MTKESGDPIKLRRAAAHVAHDVRMLREAWHRRSDPFAYTAWFVHCRSVMDFLDDRGTNSDDVHASHFFEEASRWREVRALVVEPEGYGDYRIAVNKLAAHLTYSRIDYAEKGTITPSREITEHLLGLTALFLRSLPDERLVWFGGLSL